MGSLFFSGWHQMGVPLVKEVLISWKGPFKGKEKRKTWCSVPLCIFWSIWRERNHIVFREGSIDVQRLKNFFCV